MARDDQYEGSMDRGLKLSRALQRVLWSGSLAKGQVGVEFLVFYVLFLKGERSLASIRTLVNHGLFDDAMALVRVMVEKVITAEYILLMGSEPAMDFVRFYGFSEWRNYQELKERSSMFLPQYTKKELRNLKALHDEAGATVRADGAVVNPYGRGRDWTEVSLSKRAEKVDSLMKERGKAVTTRTMFDATYKKSANYLHASFISILHSIPSLRSNERPSRKLKTGDVGIEVHLERSDPHLGVEALESAGLIAVQMLVFIVEVFNDQKTRSWMKRFAQNF
jgi:hypothetical protein